MAVEIYAIMSKEFKLAVANGYACIKLLITLFICKFVS